MTIDGWWGFFIGHHAGEPVGSEVGARRLGLKDLTLGAALGQARTDVLFFAGSLVGAGTPRQNQDNHEIPPAMRKHVDWFGKWAPCEMSP